jgi:hypothetical protein
VGAAAGDSSNGWATGGWAKGGSSNMWEQHPVAAASSGQQVGAGGGSLGAAATGWSSIRLEQQQVCNRWESWQQVGAAAGDSSNGWATGGWAKGWSMRWEQQHVGAAAGGQQVGAAGGGSRNLVM